MSRLTCEQQNILDSILGITFLILVLAAPLLFENDPGYISTIVWEIAWGGLIIDFFWKEYDDKIKSFFKR